MADKLAAIGQFWPLKNNRMIYDWGHRSQERNNHFLCLFLLDSDSDKSVSASEYKGLLNVFNEKLLIFKSGVGGWNN